MQLELNRYNYVLHDIQVDKFKHELHYTLQALH